MIEFKEINPIDLEKSKKIIDDQLYKMKFASGDVLSCRAVEIFSNINEDNEKDVRKIKRKLMLGNVLIERRDLITKSMQEDGRDALDVLLDHLKIMHRCTTEDDNVLWTSKKKEAGWLVPISVGFQGISDLGFAKNQRDPKVPHRFAESVVTLGEFVMPNKIKDLDHMLWQYHVDQEKSLYLCQTINQI